LEESRRNVAASGAVPTFIGRQGRRGGSPYFGSALRKFTASEAIVRVPTTSAPSSTKNLGLWLGAALAGS
jgi:hypothetical protein